MSILFVLVPLALLLATGAVGAFLWAVGHGEFEDLETPALRVIMDDESK
jgi:cbb3-type cytochrome oxidase maturation protein